MRNEIYQMINTRQDLKEYLREQPQWYRTLTRSPHQFQEMERAALHFHQRTIPHHVEKFSNSVQIASMMMQMFKSMNKQG